MTQEDKSFLLKDLSSRLPYNVICADSRHGDSRITEIDVVEKTVYCYDFDEYAELDKIKPYLRPMSSMTKEEKKELERLIDEKLNKHIGQEDDEWTPWVLYDTTGIKNSMGGERFYFDEMIFIYDWLNAHHFDYRGLIEKGLALEALEGMYNIKEQ
jgi:hypothetical protein